MSNLIKKSFRLEGHATSVALEEEFWLALEQIAASRYQPVAQLVAGIDRARHGRNLASALRVFILSERAK